MYKKIVQIKMSKYTLQPTIAVLKLSEAEYKDLEEWKQKDHVMYLAEETTNLELACQICAVGMAATPDGNAVEYNMFILVNKLKLIEDEKVFSFRIMKMKKTAVNLPEGHSYNPWAETKGVFLEDQQSNGRVMICINGSLFTRYLYSKDLLKPYYYPLVGPLGKTLIQDQPDDHLHHHGLWWGHDGVNGHQLYHEFRGEGRQLHKEFLAFFGGLVLGQITSAIDWLTAKGERLLQETRTMRIYSLPNDTRYIDIVCQLHATDGDVEFNDTKEGGFPFIRVNEQINAFHTGKITSSTHKTGEQEIFGQEADWVDYTGSVLLNIKKENGIPVKNFTKMGIAIFLHPDSDDYPVKWFVRDYGPITSSNFHFTGGFKLMSGDHFTFKQRLYIHKGSSEEACVEQRYDEFQKPLTAEWYINN